MSKIFIIILSLGVVSSCQPQEKWVYELASGRKVKIEKDSQGKLLNGETRKPLRFYVDPVSKDTLDGKTGKVVNGEIVRKGRGQYEYAIVEAMLATDFDPSSEQVNTKQRQ